MIAKGYKSEGKIYVRIICLYVFKDKLKIADTPVLLKATTPFPILRGQLDTPPLGYLYENKNTEKLSCHINFRGLPVYL